MILKIIKFSLRLTFTTLLTLTCLCISFIFYISTSEQGLQNTANLTSYLMPGLTIKEAHGKLFSNFTLKNVSYYSANTQITLQSIDCSWDAHQLIHRFLIINNLKLSGLRIQNFSSSEDNNDKNNYLENLKLFTQHVSIKNISLTDFNYYQQQQPIIKLNSAQLIRTPEGRYDITAKLMGGEMNGNFQLLWKSKPIWNFALNGININPGVQWNEWPGKIQFKLSGQGETNNLNLNIQNISGTLRNQQLAGKINLQLNKNQFKIQDGKFSIADSYIQLSGQLTQNWNLNWDIHIPNLRTLYPSANGSFFSAGNISGLRDYPVIQATVNANNVKIAAQEINQLSGKMRLFLKPDVLSTFALDANKIKINGYTINKINLNMTESTNINPKNIFTLLNIANGKQQLVNVALTLPKSINLENYFTESIYAKVNIAMPNLDDLKDYFPALNQPQGKINGALEMTGSLDNPKISGSLNLINASANIPKLGLALKNINFQVSGNQTKLLNYTGSLTSKNGTLNIAGKTDLEDDNLTSAITLKGNNIEVVNLSGYKIIITPDVLLNFTNKSVNFSGSITIPEASIEPKDFRNTVTLPAETTFVGHTQPSTESVLAELPSMRVEINLGDQIHIHYQNLDTILRGKIRISKNLNNSPTAVGELYTVKGTYLAYGQTLTIQNGRLIFTGGEINDPGLNITAGRDVRTIQLEKAGYKGAQTINVGVRILGTLNNPTLTLYSNPGILDHADILSYLLLGVPSSQAQGQKAQALLAVASTINIGGNGISKLGKFTSSLQKKLGLEELNVESVQTFDPTTGTVGETSSLVLGKQLTDKLYIHYSIGISNPVPILNLRYQYSKHWSVQSETSKINNEIDSGGDLLYSIERN
ncbi:MAG: translocation/assembly module TamB domain-containing protein [Gammaproteobacteria bacterium]|nr:translocation/assembly module TamB domain-containing protein [Gammaproteobacteria bacterium]